MEEIWEKFNFDDKDKMSVRTGIEHVDWEA